MAGRPSKFTKANTDKIIQALRDGMPRRWACALVRINNDTFCRWMNEGEDDLNKDLDTPKSEFYEDVIQAEADYLAEMVKDINKGDRQDKKWLITRRFNQDFGDRQQIDQKVEGKLEVALTWQDLIKNVQESDKLD